MILPDPVAKNNEQCLANRFRQLEQLKVQAVDFLSVFLNSQQLCDLEMILNGAFYPLSGYIGRADYESVLNRMRLADGTFWPLPICLGVNGALAERLSYGDRLAIRDVEGFMLAVLTVKDVWKPDLKKECQYIWGAPSSHDLPNASHIDTEDVWYVSGPVDGLSYPQHYDFIDLRWTPGEVRRHLSHKRWRKTIGVQVGRPLHEVDCSMLKEVAFKEGAGILLSPIIRPSTYYSVDHFSLVKCLQQLVTAMPNDLIKLVLMPWFERKMGPRGSLLRAIVNKNYGCSHVLIWDSAKAEPRQNGHSRALQVHYEWMRGMQKEVGITPLKELCMTFDEQTMRYKPYDGGLLCADDHNTVIETLTSGGQVPKWMSLPSIVSVLRRRYKPRNKQGFCLFFTGLSGAGKSTLAKILYVQLMERNGRPVTLLDGDTVRTNLSSELGFSRRHRNLNVTRIGFVANEIVKNGGISICAPIAPYPESRRSVREMIEENGGFIEIFVNTPLSVCEQRDCKGIYAKARAGVIKGLTGVDDPYIEPESPELAVNTHELTPNEAVYRIMGYLFDNGYLEP